MNRSIDSSRISGFPFFYRLDNWNLAFGHLEVDQFARLAVPTVELPHTSLIRRQLVQARFLHNLACCVV